MRAPISFEGVVYEGDTIKSGILHLPMTIKEGKLEGVYHYDAEVDLSGVKLDQILYQAGKSIRIAIQTIRNKNDAYVKAYVGKKRRPFHEVLSKERIVTVNMDQAIENMSIEELQKLAAKLQAKLAPKAND